MQFQIDEKNLNTRNHNELYRILEKTSEPAFMGSFINSLKSASGVEIVEIFYATDGLPETQFLLAKEQALQQKEIVFKLADYLREPNIWRNYPDRDNLIHFIKEVPPEMKAAILSEERFQRILGVPGCSPHLAHLPEYLQAAVLSQKAYYETKDPSIYPLLNTLMQLPQNLQAAVLLTPELLQTLLTPDTSESYRASLAITHALSDDGTIKRSEKGDTQYIYIASVVAEMIKKMPPVMGAEIFSAPGVVRMLVEQLEGKNVSETMQQFSTEQINRVLRTQGALESLVEYKRNHIDGRGDLSDPIGDRLKSFMSLIEKMPAAFKAEFFSTQNIERGLKDTTECARTVRILQGFAPEALQETLPYVTNALRAASPEGYMTIIEGLRSDLRAKFFQSHIEWGLCDTRVCARTVEIFRGFTPENQQQALETKGVALAFMAKSPEVFMSFVEEMPADQRARAFTQFVIMAGLKDEKLRAWTLEIVQSFPPNDLRKLGRAVKGDLKKAGFDVDAPLGQKADAAPTRPGAVKASAAPPPSAAAPSG